MAEKKHKKFYSFEIPQDRTVVIVHFHYHPEKAREEELFNAFMQKLSKFFQVYDTFAIVFDVSKIKGWPSKVFRGSIRKWMDEEKNKIVKQLRGTAVLLPPDSNFIRLFLTAFFKMNPSARPKQFFTSPRHAHEWADTVPMEETV